MVDSRQKGARAEAAAKGLLKKHTGLDWQRTPGSGSLNAAHKLKGDLYIPDAKNKFCVEVKHYKDDHLTSKIITDKSPQLLKWWEQTIRQGKQTDRVPLLLFKFDRSKWFVAFTSGALNKDYGIIGEYKYITINTYDTIINIAKLEEWLEQEDLEWIL